MTTELYIAIFSGLGAMLGWGLADFFAKKTIDQIGDVTTLFWGQLIGIVPLLGLFLLHPVLPQSRPHDLPFVVLLGLASGLTYIPTYVAFGKGKVSLLSPIFASYSAVVAILSAVFFHESLSGLQWLAVGIVFGGILLVSTNPKDLIRLLRGHSAHKTDGLGHILLAVATYSVWLVALDRFLNGRSWVPFLLVIRIFSSLALFVYAKATKRVLRIKDQATWKYLVAIGVFDVAAFSCISYGYSATSYTAIVTVLGATFSLPTMVLAWWLLKERINRLQALAAFVILGGVVLLSLS